MSFVDDAKSYHASHVNFVVQFNEIHDDAFKFLIGECGGLQEAADIVSGIYRVRVNKATISKCSERTYERLVNALSILKQRATPQAHQHQAIAAWGYMPNYFAPCHIAGRCGYFTGIVETKRGLEASIYYGIDELVIVPMRKVELI